MDCSPPGSSVHGISQARILKRVATSYSRGSSWPKDGTHISCVSCIGREILQHCTMWETQLGLNQDQTKICIFLWLLSLNSVLLSITPTSLAVTSHLHASDLLRKPSRQSWRMAPILDMLVCFLIKSLNVLLCLLISCMLQVSSEDLDSSGSSLREGLFTTQSSGCLISGDTGLEKRMFPPHLSWVILAGLIIKWMQDRVTGGRKTNLIHMYRGLIAIGSKEMIKAVSFHTF